jgi:tyrosinase
MIDRAAKTIAHAGVFFGALLATGCAVEATPVAPAAPPAPAAIAAAAPTPVLAPDPAAPAPLAPPAVTPPIAVRSPPASPKPPCTYLRKNAKTLSATEREQFITAVLKLRETPSPYDPTLNWYDQLVRWHVGLQECDPNSTTEVMIGHGGPMFLPWHRLHLLLFDEALRAVSAQAISVPYWDWSDRDAASVFDASFMGGNGDPAQNDAVVTGPFRKEVFSVQLGAAETASPVAYIRRAFGSIDRLPTPADVASALTVPVYDVAPWDVASDASQSFRNRLEGHIATGAAVPARSEICPAVGVIPLPAGAATLHAASSAFVGGTLATSAAPNDPLYYLQHANTDRIWTNWQETHGIETFVPKSGEYPGNGADDELLPFHTSDIHVTARMMADGKKLGVCYQ